MVKFMYMFFFCFYYLSSSRFYVNTVKILKSTIHAEIRKTCIKKLCHQTSCQDFWKLQCSNYTVIALSRERVCSGLWQLTNQGRVGFSGEGALKRQAVKRNREK